MPDLRVLLVGNREKGSYDEMLSTEESDLDGLLQIAQFDSAVEKRFLRDHRLIRESGFEFTTTAHYTVFQKILKGVNNGDIPPFDFYIFFRLLEYNPEFKKLDREEKTRLVYQDVVSRGFREIAPSLLESTATFEKKPFIIVLEQDLSKKLTKWELHRSLREGYETRFTRRHFPDKFVYSNEKELDRVIERLHILTKYRD